MLGAAGLLRGKRAATHWMSMDMLPAFGAIPTDERVVVDGNVITGGGVTAGIDFGLRVVAEIAGETCGARDPTRHRVRSAAAVRQRPSAQRRSETDRDGQEPRDGAPGRARAQVEKAAAAMK